MPPLVEMESALAEVVLFYRRPEPLRTQVRTAFADSIRVIWLVLIPFVSDPFFSYTWGDSFISNLKGGVGLLTALGMQSLKLETVTDEVGTHT